MKIYESVMYRWIREETSVEERQFGSALSRDRGIEREIERERTCVRERARN